jgi:hypothetical protein
VKFRLISLEAAFTIIKLSSTIYPPTSWNSYSDKIPKEEFCEEWGLRCAISNWGWRTVSALKDVQDESKCRDYLVHVSNWLSFDQAYK